MEAVKPTVSVDVRHVACPPGLWVIIPPLRNGDVGDIVEVLTTDPKDKEDIKEWVKRAGHELLSVVKEEDYERILVKKAR